jgi:hypothetical protein
MNKLELKHLAPYLPYGLKYCRVLKSPVTLNEEIKIMGEVSTKGNIHNINNNILGDYTNMKYLPILRPLHEIEDYFKELWDKKDEEVREFLDSDFLHSFDYLEIEYIHRTNVNYLPVGLYNLLLKHHFDVFALIEKGLAIDFDKFK